VDGKALPVDEGEGVVFKKIDRVSATHLRVRRGRGRRQPTNGYTEEWRGKTCTHGWFDAMMR
jgi:hypothetical protein